MNNYRELRELIDIMLSGDYQKFYDKLNSYNQSQNTESQVTSARDIKMDENENFQNQLKPGRIVVLDVKGQRYFGVILSCGTLIYFNEKGETKGYLNHYTFEYPYKIEKILIPADNCYQLKNWESMEVAWNRSSKPHLITKTISEIEKELNLAPGSLEIIK